MRTIMLMSFCMVIISTNYSFGLKTTVESGGAASSIPAQEDVLAAFTQAFENVVFSEEKLTEELRELVKDLSEVEQAKANLTGEHPKLGIQYALNIRALKLLIAFIYTVQHEVFGQEKKQKEIDDFIEFNTACWEVLNNLIAASSLPDDVKARVLEVFPEMIEKTEAYLSTNDREKLKEMALFNMELALFLRDL